MAPAGFTLIGALLLLALVVAAAVTLGPLVYRLITVSREEDTRRQFAVLVEAIVGIPAEGTFGFVGDVGRLPKSLEELNGLAGAHTLCDAASNPGAAVFHAADGGTAHRGQVGLGWRGPYVKEMRFTDAHLTDAWGQKLRYTCPQTTRAASDPTTGGVALTLRTGLITSAGPDGTFDTADDIKSEQFYDRGNLFLTVRRHPGNAIAQGATVHLFYPVDGEQTSLVKQHETVQTPEGSEETVVFASVPGGARVAQVFYNPTQSVIYHAGLRPNIANRITVKVGS